MFLILRFTVVSYWSQDIIYYYFQVHSNKKIFLVERFALEASALLFNLALVLSEDSEIKLTLLYIGMCLVVKALHISRLQALNRVFVASSLLLQIILPASTMAKLLCTAWTINCSLLNY